MSILKRLPWVSLALLVVTYAVLGWVISAANVRPFVWLVAAIAVFSLVGFWTTPWSNMANYSVFVFKSSLRTFAFVILAAFLAFLMIARFSVFLDTLVVIAAIILARIDFQLTGFSRKQAFWTLSIFSLVGLACGGFAQKASIQLFASLNHYNLVF
ncbi:MAG: hypothetical protein PUP93_12900 [Rhizonema sp. NSF051]|nr:hypothetical protein [Rhizonema sp. NSF051]